MNNFPPLKLIGLHYEKSFEGVRPANRRLLLSVAALLGIVLVAGCSDSSVSRAPTVDEIKTAEQHNVQNIEANSKLSPQQKAIMEQHMGGGPSTAELNARSGDLPKK